MLLISRLLLMETKTIIQGSMEDRQTPANECSDETGQFDPRFLLWRKFCADEDVDVNSLPGDLSGETKEQWEKFKAANAITR